MRHMELELSQLGINLANLMKIKPGSVVAITTDSAIDQSVVNAIAGAVHALGGKPLILLFPQPPGDESHADPGLAGDSLVGALSSADYWVEANSRFIHYSDTFNRVVANNPNIIHILISYLSPEKLNLVYNKVDYDQVNPLGFALLDLMKKCKTIRVTNRRGTDVTFGFDPSFALSFLSGDLSVPGLLCGLPSTLYMAPALNSLNGKIVFDAIYVVLGVLSTPIEVEVKDGKVVNIQGGSEVPQFERWLESYEDENIYKVAHANIGTLSSVTQFTGEVILDERMWGAVNFGFGSAPVSAMPPDGQPCDGHWDAICTHVSVWFDDVQILENGVYVHPELKEYGSKACR